jgi:hypothetical protein
MRHSKFFSLLAISIVLTGMSQADVRADGTSGGGEPIPSNAFTELNKGFIETYNAIAQKNLKATRPILITSGFSYHLMCDDGSVKTSPPANPVENQLKSVAHLCAYAYAICDTHWRDANDTSWKESMSQLHDNLDAALRDVDKVSWASEAWPHGETKLRDFVRSSLTCVLDFTAAALKKNDITKADYEAFAAKYTPTLQANFYLASLSNAFNTRKFLNQWKKEIGDEAWNRMRVIISAGKGRSTSGLTAETNPAALTMASVMTPENFKKNVMMDPGAATSEQALEGLALALTSSKLADAVFPTAKSRQSTWMYSALKHPDIPVALEPVKNALNDLAKGRAKDPVLGLGPNE